ncbi:hypothetical protein [Salmonella enterica]|uniref:hypothetical protein n=1 Tax=Salmonella enterica TaxID=28901 RepID=UPI000687A80C
MGYVKNAAILNVRTSPYRNVIHIAANHHKRPDPDIIRQTDIANNHAAGIDHHALTDTRKKILIRT